MAVLDNYSIILSTNVRGLDIFTNLWNFWGGGNVLELFMCFCLTYFLNIYIFKPDNPFITKLKKQDIETISVSLSIFYWPLLKLKHEYSLIRILLKRFGKPFT